MSKKYDRSDALGFIGRQVFRAILMLGIIMLSLFLVNRYFKEYYEAWLLPLTEQPFLLYGVFLTSETIIGIIPPEIFMDFARVAADSNFGTYMWDVLTLAVFSYLGGIIAFYLGRFSQRIPWIYNLIHSERNQQVVNYYRKYGGVMIVIAAITPVPFGLVSMITGSMGYTFKRFMLFASPRILRFVLYGWIIWETLNPSATAA